MKVHLIGIGGIGVSAIARMMLQGGREVSGSDMTQSEITDQLKKLGAKIKIGHNARNVHGADLVVYSPAVLENNPELKEARRLKIPTFSYPEMLGVISEDKYTIAVSGSHGKTTTTAMIGAILQAAGLSPSVIVGSLLGNVKSNFVAGKSNYLVVEACEYKRSFLNINPRIIVITNIDNDHLDYYKTIGGVTKGFAEFAQKLTKNDYLVCFPRGKHLAEVVKKTRAKIIDYSKMPRDFKLKIPGAHNLDNAQAAFAVARILQVPASTIRKSLEKYAGVWRRFEYKGKTKQGVLVYDDYGHHPTEIKATLAAAREKFGNKKIFCVFQPHLYSRTKLLLNDFAKSFDDADVVVLADIYGAREKDAEKISSADLANKLSQRHKNVVYLNSFHKIAKFLTKEAKSGNIVLTMGAGDIYKVADLIL